MSRVELDLDIVAEKGDDLNSVMRELLEGTTASWSLLQDHGPGGGWPLVRIYIDEFDQDIVLERYGGSDV